MPRVRGSTKGVRVFGQIRSMNGSPMENEKVEFALTTVCFWKGSLIGQKMVVTTDKEGNFEVYLPPTSELTSVEHRRIYFTVKHQFLKEPVKFLVPAGIAEAPLEQLLGG